MTDDEWQRDREVIDAATAGPWREPDPDGSTSGWRQQHADDIVITSYGTQFVFGVDVAACPRDRRARDAEFIARARTRWPAALAEIERLRAILTDELGRSCIRGCASEDGDECDCGAADANGMWRSHVRIWDENRRLRAFIAESRREHSQRDLRRCNKLVNVAYACTCGADDWNARVDAILGTP